MTWRLVVWLVPVVAVVAMACGTDSVGSSERPAASTVGTPLDWRPVGPARRTRKTLVDLFAPELLELDYEQEVIDGIDLPIGPSALGQAFWFRRG